MRKFTREDFNADLETHAEALQDDGSCVDSRDPWDKVFSHLIADTFETLDEDVFHYTDGARDKGIDFYVEDNGGFHVYQCKSIDEANAKDGRTFDATCVNELAEAIDFLEDESRQNACEPVERLWQSYHLNKNEKKLTATLAIQGKLSEPAHERFEELKKKYAQENIALHLVDEENIFEKWHALDDLAKPKDITLKLAYVESGMMKMNGWFCAILEIGPLIDGVERHGMALFDTNVRQTLAKSKVNDAIKNSVQTRKGQRNFVHLNNGLVITCTSFKYAQGRRQVTLQGAQVINGCQSLNTIWQCYQDMNDAEKDELRGNVRIFAKVISSAEIKDEGFIDEVILASNNQNPMNPRNLKSNTIEQREIQREFYREPTSDLKYFYIRKDGELDAFIDDTTTRDREMKPRLFKIEDTNLRKNNKYRQIDNEWLANTWWTWIGHAAETNAAKVKCFEEKLYPYIFKKRPDEEYWERMKAPEFTATRDCLEDSRPTTRQLLVAVAFWSYIEAKVKPPKKTLTDYRKKRIEKLQADGKLKANPNKQEEDAALTDDDEYLMTLWARSMTPIFTEVASFILVQRYGTLGPEVSKRIVEADDVHYWLACGMDKTRIDYEEMRGGLLERVYTYLRFASDCRLTQMRSSILAAPRLKFALGSREQICAIKKKCFEVNESMRQYPSENGLKAPGQTYLESLPDLC